MVDQSDRAAGSDRSDLDLYIENGEVLISGPTDAALAYVKRLRDVGAEVLTEELTGRRAADIAAVLATAGVARQAVNGGVYLRIAEESLPHLAKNGLIPAKDGFHTFLGMTKSGSQISHHVRFAGKPVNPAQMLNVQIILVQLALRMAIGEVMESIARVEGKVDALLKLAHADKGLFRIRSA
ncbi:hypothetical protein [Dietzia cinnamea]|uniref:hypothetical protein n=1 Tax=Dietzia cinnamea TaxID=321318 RepID=UPI00223B96F4|nr:hypothetical protein [Dietzia cinnamea]MCT2176026.1 hypothetical protein [Dietzia cinnamea]